MSYFTGGIEHSHISKFTRAVANLFQAQWRNRQEKIDPSDILRLVWDSNQTFKREQPNDAQEFLLFLLDQLHEELKRPNFSSEDIEAEEGERYWKEYISKNNSIISREFQGQTKTTLACGSCGYVKHRYEPFMYLSLGIPKRQRVSLQDCLEMFCSEEVLLGSEMWYCKKCKRLVEAKKQCEIARMPRNLIIHLKRLVGRHKKIDDLVEYREEIDMQGVGNGIEKGRYQLYAKVKHMGSSYGGHYVALAKQNESWYCFNDSSVSHESFNSSKDTYLLFYQKI